MIEKNWANLRPPFLGSPETRQSKHWWPQRYCNITTYKNVYSINWFKQGLRRDEARPGAASFPDEGGKYTR